jgi:hypothetical protein
LLERVRYALSRPFDDVDDLVAELATDAEDDTAVIGARWTK